MPEPVEALPNKLAPPEDSASAFRARPKVSPHGEEPLIDCEEDRTLRAVRVGMLREAGRKLHGHLTRRAVLVGVEGAVRPVSTPADSRPVVTRLDLTSGRP